jgi:hypothetical protein
MSSFTALAPHALATPLKGIEANNDGSPRNLKSTVIASHIFLRVESRHRHVTRFDSLRRAIAQILTFPTEEVSLGGGRLGEARSYEGPPVSPVAGLRYKSKSCVPSSSQAQTRRRLDVGGHTKRLRHSLANWTAAHALGEGLWPLAEALEQAMPHLSAIPTGARAVRPLSNDPIPAPQRAGTR